MFKIKDLAKDADALVILVAALVFALLVAFLPDAAWDHIVERARYLATLGGGVLATVAMRYLLRITGAAQQGKVMQAVAADPNAPDVTSVVAPGLYTNPPAGNPVGASVETLPASVALAGDEVLDYSGGE